MQKVRDYVVRSVNCGRSLRDLAHAAELDEKSIRQVREESWNPRATTLRKLERLLPAGWNAGDAVCDAAGTSAAEGGRP
jgi:hypothetical protein